MATSTDLDVSTAGSWQQLLKLAVRDPVELCRRLALPVEFEAPAVRAARSFPVFAPLGFIARMRLGDPHDPLLRQVLPITEEIEDQPSFVADPVDDTAARLQPGLLQKYSGRVLMITTGRCAIHCRYCFRRHYPYSEGPRAVDDWGPALARIAADDSIDEVLLSGGDPLTVVDHQLAELAERIAAIPHIRRLRVHTRLPIVIPERVTDSLISWLRGTRLTPIIVVHANHPAEIDDHVAEALAQLADAGIPLLNQAVLLRGVNDNEHVLESLCRRLVDLRVMPYYLHQLDRVAGAAHFEVPLVRGLQIIAALRSRLPGYAVPQFVQEVPGADAKQLLL